MSNKMRYRYGDMRSILVPVDSTTVVEIGDFMARVIQTDVDADATLTINYCCPVTYMVTSANAAADREKAADQFLGVAMSQSLNGQTDPVLIATEAEFELTQKVAAAIHVGDPVEVYSDGTNCEDQTIVEGTPSPIAVCVKHKTSTTLTGVLCRLIPSKLLLAIQELTGG